MCHGMARVLTIYNACMPWQQHQRQDEHERRGYQLLYTPHMANLNLWKTSGHFDFYKDGMFDQVWLILQAVMRMCVMFTSEV